MNDDVAHETGTSKSISMDGKISEGRFRLLSFNEIGDSVKVEGNDADRRADAKNQLDAELRDDEAADKNNPNR